MNKNIRIERSLKDSIPIELFDDEELCKKCHGDYYTIRNIREVIDCDFCNGTGKVNFLDNIFGKRRKNKISAGWTSTMGEDLPIYPGGDINDIIEQLGKNIAKDIDVEILKSLIS